MTARALKILHCPTTVGGNPQGLAKAERALEQDSHSWAIYQNYLSYPADRVLLSNSAPSLRSEIKRWQAVKQSLQDYDVIHYNFGQTLAPHRVNPVSSSYSPLKVALYNNVYARWVEMIDLKIAHHLGRVVAVTYQGDDARQGDFCNRNYAIHFSREVGQEYYNDVGDRLKRQRIAIFDRHADLIYAVNPDLMHVLPKRAKFIPYASVDLDEWRPAEKENIDGVPHVIHAPSHRDVKGTKYILDAFDRLKSEGIPFRYTLVEGMSNVQAKEIYKTADLLVDQLLAGYYGGLSVELMALAKPVICYVREEDMHYLPAGMNDDMPVINATPESIYYVLKEYLTIKKGDLPHIGRKSRAYVERWHDPKKIAAQLIADYQEVYTQKRSAS